MSRRLGARVDRLESRIGAVPDLAGEAQQYGHLLWSTAGFRGYGDDGPDGARLSVVAAAGTVVYAVAGVTLADLS